MMRYNGEAIGGIAARSNNRLQIVLAWRSSLMRTAMAALLERLGHRVTVETGDWPGLLAAGIADLSLVDIEIVPAHDLKLPAMPVIVIAPSPAHPAACTMIERGVAGLALGSESTDSLRLCLATVAGGGRWFDPAVIGDGIERAEATRDAASLTRRERDVARLVATGQRNRAIAGSLGISEGTVKMHLHNVYAKLGLESRTQLAMDERMRMRG